MAVLARCHALSNIPGLNGDEAWYGVQAWSLAQGQGALGWRTPTGNPINPLFFGPLTLLHGWLLPSITLLRSVAVVSGLLALVLNWFFCRRVFDRRTAVVSTILLAVLPINVAYSRFAWDASQSLGATLAVVYLSLAALRFPERFVAWLLAALVAQAAAVWIHPTNVFVAPVIGLAMVLHWVSLRSEAGGVRSVVAGLWRPLPIVLLSVTIGAAVAWLGIATSGSGSLTQRLHERLVTPAAGASLPQPILLARFFVGGTVYRDIVGSRSWLEWPLPANQDGWGADVALFWALMAGAMWLLWQSGRRVLGRKTVGKGLPFDGRAQADTVATEARLDLLLLCGWLAALMLFAAVAGARALLPGQERFAVCLVAPAAILFSRSGALAWAAISVRWRPLLVAGAMGMCLLWMADFYVHYFVVIKRSGGNAHYTFRTAAVEPKVAALRFVAESGPGPKWIVCSQWWNYWPIRYLASADGRIHVLTSAEAVRSEEYRAACGHGQAWYVEFGGTQELQELQTRLGSHDVERQEFLDFGGRPVLCVLHPRGDFDGQDRRAGIGAAEKPAYSAR